MIPRSWLFVPGDSERKLAKAPTCGADAVILDLEDSVAAARLPTARALVAAFLAEPDRRSGCQAWVRVNPLTTVQALADLAAVVPASPDGIMLPKVDGVADVLRLSHYLSAFETASGLSEGATGIAVVATETPAALFALGSYAAAGPRLRALTWGAEDLSAALGASDNREPDGSYTFPYRLARTLCLAAAAAAGAGAVDTVYTDFRDRDGLAREARAARVAGFVGKLAVHPDQVPDINAAFSPSAAEIDRALRVTAAFDQAGGQGVVALDGKMLDMPHLKQARRILDQASRAASP